MSLWVSLIKYVQNFTFQESVKLPDESIYFFTTQNFLSNLSSFDFYTFICSDTPYIHINLILNRCL